MIDMKKIFWVLAMATISFGVIYADDYGDDIYYNPNKEKKVEIVESQEYETGDFINGRDVDEYNRFGGYYESDIDTIGNNVGNAEDFVYTKQIQKYYNPTIVVDNMEVFEDVMSNSYGNVEIVVNAGVPTIATWYTPYYSPYYAWGWPYSGWSYWNSWRWSWGPTWAWNSMWYDPWYYDPWYPCWEPTWHPGPAHPHGVGHFADYRPHGNSTNRVGGGWANSTRNNYGSHRVSGNVGSNRGNALTTGSNHRMSGNKGYRVNNDGFRQTGTSQSATHRQSGTTVKSNNYKNNSTKMTNNTSTRRNNSGYTNGFNSTRRGSNFNQGGSHRSGSGNFGGGRSSGGSRGGGSRGGGGHRR